MKIIELNDVEMSEAMALYAVTKGLLPRSEFEGKNVVASIEHVSGNLFQQPHAIYKLKVTQKG